MGPWRARRGARAARELHLLERHGLVARRATMGLGGGSVAPGGQHTYRLLLGGLDRLTAGLGWNTREGGNAKGVGSVGGGSDLARARARFKHSREVFRAWVDSARRRDRAARGVDAHLGPPVRAHRDLTSGHGLAGGRAPTRTREGAARRRVRAAPRVPSLSHASSDCRRRFRSTTFRVLAKT